MRERQQMPTRRCAGDTGPLCRQGGVQALPLRVKGFKHSHAFGHAFDHVGLGDGESAR